MQTKMEKYFEKLEQGIKGHEEDLTINSAVNHAKAKWGLDIKVNAIRTAIRRSQLKAIKLKDIGWYSINPEDFKYWLIQTKRL